MILPQPAPLSAKIIAGEFLKMSAEPLTPLRLHILTYLAQGWWLARNNESLISEPILAAEQGPFIQSIEDLFQKNIVKSIAHNQDLSAADLAPEKRKMISDLLRNIFEEQGQTDILNLLAKVRGPYSLWKKYYRQDSMVEIPKEVIQQEFKDRFVAFE